MRVRINSLTKYGMNEEYSFISTYPKVGQEYEGTLIPACGIDKECVSVNGYYIHPDDYEVVSYEEVTE